MLLVAEHVGNWPHCELAGGRLCSLRHVQDAGGVLAPRQVLAGLSGSWSPCTLAVALSGFHALLPLTAQTCALIPEAPAAALSFALVKREEAVLEVPAAWPA